MKRIRQIGMLAVVGVFSSIVPVSAENMVLYDGNGLHIEAKDLEKAAETDKIGLYVENNSDLSLGVSSYAYAVNGIMAGGDQYGFNSVDVAPGKKANATIDLVEDWEDKDFFKDYQIDDVSNFDILFWAYDNDESFKVFDSGQIHVDLKENAIESPVFENMKNIYDQNGIKVDFVSNTGNEFNFCITNNTGEYFSYNVENISYNDFTTSEMDYDLFNKYILNGCKALITVKPSDDFLADNDITDVTKVDFSLKIRPSDDYVNDYSTDVFSFEL